MAKAAKTLKAVPKAAPKSAVKTVPKAPPAHGAVDDILLAYAIALGNNFDLVEASAPGFKKYRYKQNLTSDGAYYIARNWTAKTLKTNVLNDTRSRLTITNSAIGDAVEFVGDHRKAVKAKMADTEEYCIWKDPLFPPVVMAGVRMDVVNEARAEVENRAKTHAFPPAARALETAQRSKYILRKTPVGKYGQWSKWNIVELKTFAKCLKDSSLSVFEYAAEPEANFDNDCSMGELVAHAVFCAASDPKNEPVVSFMFAGTK